MIPMMSLRSGVLLGLMCWFLPTSQAQLVINEVCSSNQTIIADEENDFPDWIELYNGSDQTINLSGYSLSDDMDNPDRWIFPNINIPAQSYLLIFASGKNFLGEDPHTNFKLSKDGEFLMLSDPSGNLIDELFILALDEDVSYGRQPDGSPDWYYFLQPSPANSNNGISTVSRAMPPIFETTQRNFSESTAIVLSCPEPNCTIYFTRDGHIPDQADELYTEPILLDSTTAIRARVFIPGAFPSEIITTTYFINENHTLPIMALTTEPELLWDEEEGIFTLGPDADPEYPFYGANYWQDIEVPVNMEFLENDFDPQLNLPLGLKTHGGRSARTRDLKSVRLLAKAKYGTPLIDYSFYDYKFAEHFKRIVLRNASGDYNRAHMRDAFLARYYIKSGLNIDVLAHRPVVYYVNGIYHGVMNLREKSDKFFLEYDYGADIENVDLLEEDTIVVEGSFEIFDAMEAFVLNNDQTQQEIFDTTASYFDVEHIADYYIAQTAINNFDWPHNNIKFWRERKAGSRWRYLLFDMDVAMHLQGWTKASADIFGNKMPRDSIRHIKLFKKFLENTNYRHYFLNRYADLLNTIYRTEIFIAEIKRSRDEIAPEMERHLPMWGKTYDNWYNNEVEKLITFAELRPPYARQYLMDYFGLDDEVELDLQVYPPEAGQIAINTITPEQLPWDGIYFQDIPVKLNAIANPGFTFSHWESAKALRDQPTSTAVEVAFTEDESLVAVFRPADAPTATIQVVPNPVQQLLEFEFTAPQLDQYRWTIVNSLGQQYYEETDVTLVTGIHQFQFQAKDLPPGTYFLYIANEDEIVAKTRFVKY